MSKKWKKLALEQALTTNKSWRQIAKELGVAKSTLSDFLREAIKEDKIQEVVTKENAPKILFIDTETSLISCYVFSLWKQTIGINQIIEDWYFLCYSAKWLGSDEVINDSLHHYDLNKRYKYNEPYLVENMWKLLDEADVIVGYNGVKFDKKKMNAKFLEYGLPEPSPYKIIDPYLIVRENFSLTSNKLDYVTKLLDGEGKHPTNMKLWIGCMNDNLEQLEYMSTYCGQDVLELERVYELVKHWNKRQPQLAFYYESDKPLCNTCGSDQLTKLETKAHTGVSSFNVFRCDGCGKILRDRVNTVEKDKRKNLLMNVN